jgi:hypothetical protein
VPTFEKVKEVPPSGARRSWTGDLVAGFIAAGEPVVRVVDLGLAPRVGAQSLAAHIRRHGLPVTVQMRQGEVYLSRTDDVSRNGSARPRKAAGSRAR